MYRDSKELSLEEKHNSMGDAAQPLTRSAIFALPSAKKRKPSDLEDGEIQSPKRAKVWIPLEQMKVDRCDRS